MQKHGHYGGVHLFRRQLRHHRPCGRQPHLPLPPGLLELLMEDHSFVNDMARLKHISPEEAAASGTKTNVVSRVIGPNPDVYVDAAIIYPHVGDVFLLCSDGSTT